MSALRRIQLSWQVITLIFRADRRRALLSLTPISPVAAGASYVAARNLLGALPGGERSQVVSATVLFAIAFLASAWLGRVARTARLQVGEATTFEFQVRRAGAVLAPMGVEHLDDPGYLDRLETLRARSFDVNQAPRMFGWMIDSVGGLVVSIALLVSVHPTLALVILGGVPAAVFNGREQTRIREARTAEAERTRRAQHFYDLATRPETAAEVRMADVGDALVERYATEWRTADRSQYRAELRAGLINAAGWLAQALAFALAVAGLVDTIRNGTVGPADLFLALGAMSLVVGQVSQAVGGITSLGQILWLFDSLDDLERQATPATDGAASTAPERLDEGISLRNVSFAYDAAAADVEALHDVSLDIAAGDVVAIVGDNGAGKSTLVKLLFGLYQPDTGTITVDGTPLSDIDPNSWRASCSACFQDHLQLELPARESIGAGSLEHLDDAPRVAAAADAAGSTTVIERLPDGLDTQLGVRFGGHDLSGGEWQRVALSRAMMRDHPLVVALDEPSASLDPLTEHQLFQRYAVRARELGEACGAVTVLVSHRFSTVSMADRIVVLESGRVVETGTHDELVSLGGLYADMYELQARHYR